MQIEFIVPVLYGDFRLENNLCAFHDICLTNENKLITSFFKEREVRRDLGNIDLTKLVSHTCFYFKGESWYLRFSGNQDDMISFGPSTNSYVFLLSFALWFIKDNSCITTVLYLKYLENNPIKTMKDSRNTMVSNASGLYQTTVFYQNEISSASALVPKLIEYFIIPDEDEYIDVEQKQSIYANLGGVSSAKYNNINRTHRALNFLQLARLTSVLPQKISNYIAVLECLFTTDNSEVAFKVNLRTTLFVGGEKQEKLQNFEILKQCYSIRSKYLHGQELDKKHNSREKLIEYSIKLDEILRKLFAKILQSDEHIFSSDSNINDYFHNLILD